MSTEQVNNQQENTDADRNEGGGGVFGSIAAFAFGFFVMKALPPQVAFMLLGGLVAGFVAGLVPYFVAKARRQTSLASWALGLCSVSGVIMGIMLAGPVALVMTLASVIRERGDEDSEDELLVESVE